MAQETILVVDDSSEFAQTLTKYMLIPLGYHVLYAANGEQGLDVALTHSPDLIISDMNMPRLDGMGMLSALRQAGYQPPVIFMTMHGSESIVVQAFRLGVRDYLMKPFTVIEVEQAIDHALQETRLAHEKEELTRNLAASEAIRQTTITLAHYVNNYLMALNGNLTLLQEDLLQKNPSRQKLLKMAQESQTQTEKIDTVLRVLQRVTKVQQTTYHGQVSILDIEAALREELEQL